MKKIYTLLLVAFASTILLHAEDTPKGNYFITQTVGVTLCDINGTPIKDASGNDQVFYPPVLSKITYQANSGDDKVIVYFWNWNGKDAESVAKHTAFNAPVNPADAAIYKAPDKKYFLMNLNDFQLHCHKMENRFQFSAGTVYVPIKFRVKPYDYTKDFTIGPAVGLKIIPNRLVPLSLHLLGSVGVSSVTLDSLSTNGAVTETEDKPAVSISGAFVVEYKKFQLGFFTGWDGLSARNHKKDWVYSDKPWIGIGIGFALFSTEGNNASSGNQ